MLIAMIDRYDIFTSNLLINVSLKFLQLSQPRIAAMYLQ